MVESITYKYINGNLAQEYAANWKVESQNLPSGSTIKTSEVPSQLTITVPANNTSSTRSGKIVLLQPASGKRITLNYSQVPQRYIISTKYFCVGNPDNGNYIYDANTETYETHVDSTMSRMISRFSNQISILMVLSKLKEWELLIPLRYLNKVPLMVVSP